MKKKRVKAWLCLIAFFISLFTGINPIGVQASTEEIIPKGTIIGKIENPLQDHRLTEDFFIKGYALSTSGIAKVEVFLDNKFHGNANYGIERKDIGDKYNQSYKDAYKSGYTYSLKGASNGSHVVTVKVTDNDGATQSMNINVITNNSKKLVMGQGSLSRNQMVQDLFSRCSRLTNYEMRQFVEHVVQESAIEGVNHDVAFALMMLETNYLNFGGDVKPGQNNFAGLGATGNGVPGESFPTVQIGVRAVIQHLKAYGSTEPLVQELVDTRFNYVTRGSALYVEHLGIKENPEGKGWAAGQDYGIKINNIIARMNSYSNTFNDSSITKFDINGEAKVGNELTISVDAIPSRDTLFKISVTEKGTDNVKVLSNYSSNKVAKFIPDKNTTYTFEVNVKHVSSAKAADDTWTKDIYVSAGASTIENVSITGDMVAGHTITISAKANPLKESLYRIWIKDGEEWKVISDYSSKNSATYVPKNPGNYAVQVDVKHVTSNKNYDDVWSKLITVTEPIDIKIKSVEVTGKMETNSPISIKVNASQSNDILYKYWIKENGVWNVIKDYSESNSISYTPKKAGSYAVQVDIKHKNSSKNYDDVWSKLLTIRETNKSLIESVDVSGDMLVGNELTIKVATNPTEDTLIKYWIKENGTWRVLKDYSATNTIKYVPKTTGQYAIQVDVKHKNSTKTYDDVWSKLITVKALESSIAGVDITGKLEIGQDINIKVNANPSNDTLYRFWIKDETGWNIIKDYSNVNTAIFKPTKSGKYAIQVDVKHKSSSKNFDEAWSQFINIEDVKPVIKSVDITGEMQVARTLTIKANLEVQNSDTLYRIWVRENGNWKVISDYSNKNVATYVPQKTGEYAFQVDVKRKNASVERDHVWTGVINVNKEATSKIQKVEVHGEMKAGKPITIKVDAEPAVNTLYKIWIKENGTWKVISEYSDKNSVVYIPKNAGNYAIQVNVKHKLSIKDSDDVITDSIDVLQKDSKIIVIDPGHGKQDPGAVATHGATTFREAVLNLQISAALKPYLEQKGYTVLMTRYRDDEFLELTDRARFANNVMADLFMSIHCNSATPSATGVEVFYNEDQIDEPVRQEVIAMGYPDPVLNHDNRARESKTIAQSVSSALASSLGLANRGAKSYGYNVIRNTVMPAILIECGFITNSYDIILLSSPSNQDTIARAIANTIARIL